MSGANSEHCWASRRHLPVCTLAAECERTAMDLRALRSEADALRVALARSQAVCESLADRVAGQSELLSRRAEKRP